jgi:hypothetical protein
MYSACVAGPVNTPETRSTLFTEVATSTVDEASDVVQQETYLAAAQFNWLVMAEPLNRAMLLGMDDTPPAAELERYAEHAVRTFLAAHRPGSS